MRTSSVILILAACLFCSCSEDSGGELFYVDIVNPLDGGLGIGLVPVPAGSFLIGSSLKPIYIIVMDPRTGGEMLEWNYERPVHAVSLDAFKISTTEITQEQFKAVMGFNPSLFSGSPNLPVERVTWIDAATFCNKLSLMTSLDTCYNLNTLECDFARSGYRLPTEAEWEYACRAGTATEYYVGSDTVSMKIMAWCLNNSERTTHPVGMKEPNALGLYDMHGNVFEWCADYYAIYHCSSEDNPQGPAAGRYRTIRGGSWFSGPDSCRSAFRMSTYPFKGFSNVGFRVVRR